jgi:hypothetical protein
MNARELRGNVKGYGCVCGPGRNEALAIRKDGAYVMGEEKVATGEMNEEELILKAIGILQAKVEPLS